MRQVGFRCRRCGHKFVRQVLEPGEAQERRVRPVPVCCLKCGSPNVVRV